MIDVETPQSPGWWLARCWKKLNGRMARLEKLAKYRDGDPPLPKRAEAEKDAFKAFLRTSRLNMAESLVSSINERLAVRAIRTAVESTRDGDSAAWDVFVSNDLETTLPDVLDNMLGLSDGYMMVGVDPDLPVDTSPGPEDVWVTAEDPRQVITIHNPARQSMLRAAAKFWHDPELELDYAKLFLPGRVFTASKLRKAPGPITFGGSSWSWDESQGGEEGISLPAGMEAVVPVVRFRNRHGVAEFERHLDVMDRINHMILQRMVIVTMQAFKQRALKGDFPRHYPEDWPDVALRGKEINYDEMFESSPDAIWLLPGAADIWESGQADIQGVLSAVQDDLKHLAAATRRPFWIFAPDNQSASGADHANDGLVFATKDRSRRAGRALARVMSIALTFMGDPGRAAVGRIAVDWMPFEQHSLQTKAAAARDAKAAGHSDKFILEHVWQLTPEEIELEEQSKAAEQLANMTLTGASSG